MTRGRPKRSNSDLALFAARRLVAVVPLIVFVSIVSFALVHLMGGDPARQIAGDTASPEQVERIRVELGLDRPLVVQFGDWFSGALRGDLGTSLFSSVSVTDTVLERLPLTVVLAIGATTIATVVGFGLALAGARKPGGLVDRGATAVASVGQAIPAFWLGLVLVSLFALRWSWFPATGYTRLGEDPLRWLRSIALPTTALAVPGVALITRQAQSALASAMATEHVTMARTFGYGRRTIMWRYVIPTAAVPVIVQAGLLATTLLGGSLVVEQVFSMPGLGQLAVNAVGRRDIPMVQGLVIVTAIVVAIINLVTDLAQACLDPRTRSR